MAGVVASVSGQGTAGTGSSAGRTDEVPQAQDRHPRRDPGGAAERSTSPSGSAPSFRIAVTRWQGVSIWAATTLVAAGLVGASIAVSRPAPTGAVERLVPTAGGTTWLYGETTDGRPNGTATVRVAGAAVFAGTRSQAVEVHFDDYLGRGTPYDELRYQTVSGDRLLQLGSRSPNGRSTLSPPQVDLSLPLRPGRTFAWHGSNDNPKGDTSVTTTVVAVEDVVVAGTPERGCPHLHDEAVTTRAGQPDFAVTTDRWLCPGVGTVRSIQDAPSVPVHLDEELLGVHGPTVSLGPPGPPGAGAAQPEAPDRARTGDVDSSRLVWSDTRSQALQFAPTGRDGLMVAEEDDGSVSALDTFSGRLLWRVDVAAPTAAPPIVAGDLVAVPDGAKHVLGVDAATGATRWSARFPDVVSAGPVVVGETVVVATDDATMRGIGRADGRIRWSATLPSRAVGITVDGDAVITATSDGGVRAVTPADGATRWTAAVEGLPTAAPAVGSGSVVVADDSGELSAFDARTGRLRWSRRRDAAASVNRDPAIADTTVVVVHGGTVEALDLGDGHSRWQVPVGGTATAPLVVGGDVVVHTRDRLLLLALADGRLHSSATLGGPSPSLRPRAPLPPVLIGNDLVVSLILDPGGPWPRSTLLAYPVGASPASGPAGVRFTGEIRPLPTFPTRAPVLRGDDLVVAGSDGVFDVPGSAKPRALAPGTVPENFLTTVGDLVLTSDGDNLVALGPTGPRWRFPMGAPTLLAQPAAGTTSVFVPVPGVGLASLDAATGAQHWLVHRTGDGDATPLVLPGEDVVVGAGGLYRLDAATGAVQWQVDGFEAFAPMAQDAGTVFAGGTLNDAPALVAVDATTGRVRWQAPILPKLLMAPAVAGSAIVVAASDDTVQVLDSATGRARWSVHLTAPVAGSPVVVGDKVVVDEGGRPENGLQKEHRVTVRDLATGRYLGSFQPAGTPGGLDAFTAAGGRLVVPSLNRAYLLDLAAR